MKALTEGVLKGRLSRDAALVCAVFLGLKIDIDNDAEEIDMCKAIRDFKRECIKEGIQEGKKLGLDEGKKLGEERAVRKIIKNLLRRSFSLLDICTITGASEEMVRSIALTTQQ